MSDLDKKVVIRSANTEDCPQIVSFLKQEGVFKPAWASEENLISILKQDSDLIQIAILGDQIIGFMVLTPHGANQYFFYRFIIKSNLRDKGIGSQLLKSAEEVVKQKGGRKIALYVEADKKNLKEFYVKRGYTTDGILYHSYAKILD